MINQWHTKLNLIRLNTFRDKSVSISRLCRLDDSRTNFALESAISLPEPIAMPTSAAVRACNILISAYIVYTRIRTHRRIVNTISNHSNNFPPEVGIVLLASDFPLTTALVQPG